MSDNTYYTTNNVEDVEINNKLVLTSSRSGLAVSPYYTTNASVALKEDIDTLSDTINENAALLDATNDRLDSVALATENNTDIVRLVRHRALVNTRSNWRNALRFRRRYR